MADTVRPDGNDPFIDELARLIVPMGMPPIAARMQGYIMLCPEPVSLDELVAALGISKSSASVAARLLERYGILLCHTERGTKRVRYGVAGHCGGFLAEQARFIGTMAALLARRAETEEQPATAARLQDMAGFYTRVQRALDTALAGK